MADFTMPSLGADMDEGTVLEWLVHPGDAVHKGDIVAVVDTAKAAVEVETFVEGVVTELLVDVGAKVPVGTPLARIDSAGMPVAVTPAAAGGPTAPEPRRAPRRPPLPATHPEHPVTPLIRTLAAELGVDLATVTGTGARGRITRKDVSARRRGREGGCDAPGARRAHAGPAGPRGRSRPPARHAVRAPAGPRARRRPRHARRRRRRRRRPGPTRRRAARERTGIRASCRPRRPLRRTGRPPRPRPPTRPTARVVGSSGPHARGDRPADGPLEARDPALLPVHHRRPGPGARLDAGAQPRPSGRPSAWCPQRSCSRRRRSRPASTRSSTGSGSTTRSSPAAACTWEWRSPCAAAGWSPRPSTTPTRLTVDELMARVRDLVAPRPGRPAARLRDVRPDAHGDQPRRPGRGVGRRGDLPAPGRPRRLRPGRRAPVGGRRAARRSARSSRSPSPPTTVPRMASPVAGSSPPSTTLLQTPGGSYEPHPDPAAGP